MLGLKEYTDFPESIRPPVEVWINCTGDLCLPYEECRNLLNGLGTTVSTSSLPMELCGL